MWKRLKERYRYSRAAWNWACFFYTAYAMVLMLAPFMAKAPEFEHNYVWQAWLFLGITLNIPIASWMGNNLLIWHLFVETRERIEEETGKPYP